MRLGHHGIRAGWTSAVLLAIGAAAWLLRGEDPSTQTVTATPHTISYVDHPYDPDWPDVYLILTNKCISCHRANNDEGLCDLSNYKSVISCRDFDDELVGKPGRAED